MEILDGGEHQNSRSPLHAFDVAGATFPLIKRGYDPAQVTWFLQGVAEDVADYEHRIADLERDLAAAREELRTANRIDEVTVAHFLGEESARMLTAARDTATDLTNRSEARSAAAIADAEAHAASIRREAETDTRRQRKETEAACAASVEEAEARATRITNDAEAQRRQVLTDLSHRRDLASDQFRQMMTGRDALVKALKAVELTAHDLTGDLDDFALAPANFVSVTETVTDAIDDGPKLDVNAVVRIERTSVTEAGTRS
jgi:DivIVA domain-containing protein